MSYCAEYVRNAVDRAVADLISRDAHLLAADCSERSLTHQLARHLSRYFEDFDVDCEYNRDGFDVKKLQLSAREVCDDELDAVTVFPDIIVHIRGRSNKNLLVIEVKKASSSISATYDIAKLHAFKDQLFYSHAVHLVVGYKRDGTFVSQQLWQ